MELINGLRNLKKRHKGSIIAIGAFDGVHIGHQYVIKKAVVKAKKINAPAMIMTFAPHPEKFLSRTKYIPLLISLKHRIELFAELGADFCLLINFTKSIAKLSPGQFVEEILAEKLGARCIFVGKNFSFGKDAEGDADTLKKISKKYNIKVEIINLINYRKKPISSTSLRNLIRKGELKQAERLFNRPVSILGTVVGGEEIGRAIGFPTANINPHHEAIPPSGVYAVLANFKNRIHKGVLNIGFMPAAKIEAHIFNFKKRIYGQDMRIDFVKKIRDEKRFSNRELLLRQIKKDVKKAKGIFKKVQFENAKLYKKYFI